MNYGRIEAAYPQLELLDLSARKLLHLVVEWLMQVVDPDEWDKRWKPLLYGDPRLFEMRREAKKRMKPAVAGEEGAWSLKPVPKPDVEDKPEPRVVIPGMGPSITVSDDGNLEVSE